MKKVIGKRKNLLKKYLKYKIYKKYMGLLYNTQKEVPDIILPFISGGLKQSEKIVLILGDASSYEEILKMRLSRRYFRTIKNSASIEIIDIGQSNDTAYENLIKLPSLIEDRYEILSDKKNKYGFRIVISLPSDLFKEMHKIQMDKLANKLFELTETKNISIMCIYNFLKIDFTIYKDILTNHTDIIYNGIIYNKDAPLQLYNLLEVYLSGYNKTVPTLKKQYF